MFENSKWIMGNSNTKSEYYEQTPAPYIARTFTLLDVPVKAVLNVCGLGEAAYFINGNTVPDSYRPTVWTNVLKNITYNVYNVTNMLKKGKNRFAAILGNMRASRLESSLHVPAQMILQLDIEYADGRFEQIVSDKEFRTADSPIIFSSECCGEIYDARKEIDDCFEPEFDDSAWNKVIISAGPGGEYRTTQCPPIRKFQEYKGIEIRPKLFDFGIVTAGYVKVCVTGKSGSVIKLKYSERLLENGHVNMYSYSKWKYPDMMNCDMYILDGTPNKCFEQYFSIHGFRYVEVEGEYEKISLTAVTAHTALKRESEFKCSNEIINKIHLSCDNSVLTCTQGVVVDNPRRDLPWLGDLMLSSETMIVNYDTYGLFDKIMQDCIDEQRSNGLIPYDVPALFPEWEQGRLLGPDWGDSAIFHIPYYTYLYTGDTTFIKKMWNTMKKSIEFFKNLSSNYIICEDIGTGDWSAVKPGCSIEVTSTSFFYLDAIMMSEMSALIGENSEYYTDIAKKIKDSFRNKYVSNGKMKAKHISELIIPAYVGLLDKNEKNDAIKRIAAQIEEDGYAFTFGVLGLRMVFDLLSENDLGELVFKTVINDRVPGYAKNVVDGFKTLTEVFDRERGLWVSHNHHFFSMIDTWFYKWVAGIRYENFADRHLVISPLFLKDIEEVSAKLRDVSIRYDRENLIVESGEAFILKMNGEQKEFAAGKYVFKRC